MTHEEQVPECHHYGVECEKPCDTHCPCDDCQDDEIEEDEEMDPNPGGPDVW